MVTIVSGLMIAFSPDRIRDNLLMECYYPLAMALGCAVEREPTMIEVLADELPLERVLRAAPGGIAAVSAAPVLLKTESQGLLHSDDLTAWNTPLVVPFQTKTRSRLAMNCPSAAPCSG